MDKKMVEILDDLSKKPTTELALQVMELTSDNMVKDKKIKNLKEDIENKRKELDFWKINFSQKEEIINKVKKYLKSNKVRCYYGKCEDGDLLVEIEEDTINEILDILK